MTTGRFERICRGLEQPCGRSERAHHQKGGARPASEVVALHDRQPSGQGLRRQRALPLEVPPANAADLRRLAAQAGGADMSDAAPLVQFWLRRSFGLGGANEPLRRAGFTAIDYGRDVQVLAPRALVRQ